MSYRSFPEVEESHWEDGEIPPRWLGLAVLTLLIALASSPFLWLVLG